MPARIPTAANEGRIQAPHNRRRRLPRPGCRTILQRLTGSQGVAAQGLMVLSGVDREHLLQHLSGRPVAHQGAEMRLKLIQLRGRLVVRWPADTSLDPATRGTAKSRKPHRDPAEKRRYAALPVVLHMANLAAARAGRPPSSVVPGLLGDEGLLEAGQQKLRIGQGQTQIDDIAEIGGPDDLHNVRALSLALGPGFHQPQNPRHAPTLGQKNRHEKSPSTPYTPTPEAVPWCMGLPQEWGSGRYRHWHWRVWIVGWVEFLSVAGTERAIVDGTTDLQQEGGPASRPTPLLGFVS